MENPEGVLNLLDEFAKLKSKEIPNDLEEYLLYVAASGDPVYQWSLIKSLYRQKLINVITEFYETCPMMDIPPCPNVDPFNYETLKNSLLDKLDAFSSAPFTIQRISELLTNPRKQYNRVDKFMRAIEKNIWVVSTREPGQREAPVTQENSSNLVNGVAPRVHVTVKHPKRGKSIEERIKSGHPQLIDDDDEEEEEEEQMEIENNVSSTVNNETDDTPLQCTSVKDLIEKYENGTIFCNAEEKTEFDEKSGNQIEESTSSTSSNTAAAGSAAAEDASEKEIVPTDSDNSSEPEDGEEDSEDSNLEKIIPTEPIVEIENVLPNEEDSKNENDDSKIDDESTNEAETEPETETEAAAEPIVENPKEESSSEAVEVYYEEEIRPEGISNGNEEQTSATEITETEASNETEQILEQVVYEDEEKEKSEGEKDEGKIVENNETEVADEKETESVTEKAETEEDSSKKIGTESRILLELESEWSSSSPDDANLVPAKLTEANTPEPDFVESEPVKQQTFFEKFKSEKEAAEESAVTEEVGEPIKEIEPIPETCAEIAPQATESPKAEILETPIEVELDLPNEVLDSKMEENDLEEKSNDMIVEENDKIDGMEVDDSCTNSPMAQEEILEPMDDDAGHS